MLLLLLLLVVMVVQGHENRLPIGQDHGVTLLNDMLLMSSGFSRI